MKWFYGLTLAGSLLTSAADAECLNFTLETGRFNLPLVNATVFNQSIEFVLDLGMAQGLSVEPKLFNKISSKRKPEFKQYSDLNGDSITTRQKLADSIRLNHFVFDSIEVSESKPWGVVLAAASEVEMPANTMGLGLFKKKGVLHYSRKEGFVKWCENHCVFPSHTIWHPLIIDKEGVHVQWNDRGRDLDLVLDSASTFSMLKKNRVNQSSQCPNHEQYQCYYSNKENQEAFYLLDLPAEFQADGLLGDSFFQTHDVLIDRMNHRLGIIEHKANKI